MYLEGNMRHSICQVNEIACLGYICTTGSELQRCINANRAACNKSSPRRSRLV